MGDLTVFTADGRELCCTAFRCFRFRGGGAKTTSLGDLSAPKSP